MSNEDSTKSNLPSYQSKKRQSKQHISGTVFFDGHKFYLKSRSGNFLLLPQGRIFICFSRNTSEEVLSVQNELLLENLRPNQIVEWQPLAWNAIGNTSTFGVDSDAQNAIDTFADNADHIVFVVKDSIYEGLMHEWEFWTTHPQGKKIYLFIYDNDKKTEIHNSLDPSKKIIYYSYKSSNDILVRLLREITPELELSLENQKLSFVRTTSALRTYKKDLKGRITKLKSSKHIDTSLIEGLERHLQFVERNQDQIIGQNKKIVVDIPIEKSRHGQFLIKPINFDTPVTVLGEPHKIFVLNGLNRSRGTKSANRHISRKGIPSKKNK